MAPASPTVNAAGNPRTARRGWRRALLLAAPLLLAGCSFFEQPTQLRGNRVDPELLSQLTPGVQGKQDVIALIGSPTSRGTFDDNYWYYISADTRIRIGRSQAVNNQQVTELRFDANGKYAGSRVVGEDGARQLDLVERETPVPGGDRTVLQQLFGNIGRFGPGAGGAQAGQPTGRQ
ncbi:outer membrane protein assembly factor BamE [Roseomonas sp. NAR14]|uniref:Outer membrane protein assembly factor BamE n=1 Tax=Roseomonas acroporae TaxID=2937791 RepID=A0A9X1Y839_9PROT|nr:outer membrane protein assembly factor BamE [Roseomonas acroporae]MCK8783842.1 outer membrane protein assembly factor BamE [Roseomonas acroporae]